MKQKLIAKIFASFIKTVFDVDWTITELERSNEIRFAVFNLPWTAADGGAITL